MLQKFDQEATRIEISTWERRSLFELFNSYSEPFHGICVRVDCTTSFAYAKEHHLSVFLTLVHRALMAAQGITNLRTRIVDESVWSYKSIHGGSAVGRENGTIGFGHYVFKPQLHDFVADASHEVERVRQRDDLERLPIQNLIRFSVLPWLDFTSLSHARDFSRPDSAPKFTFGKITAAKGRHTMPVSIHVHHALADGLHVAQFVEQFEQYLASPQML